MEKRGRKSKWEQIEEQYPRIKTLKEKGVPEREIARDIGVAYSTWSKYKKENSEFSRLLEECRNKVVADLRAALIERALGIEKTVKKAMKVKTVTYENGKRLKEEERVEYYDETIYCPPDVSALNLALKNYDRNNWSGDPQTLKLKKEELALKKKQLDEWGGQ